jgi:hypothetical protein
MAKITYTDKVSIVSNPNPLPNKVTSNDLNEIKTSVNALYDVTGHIVYTDEVNDTNNKQVLTANISNVITIVDTDPDKSQSPLALGNGDLWVGNKITPIAEGDGYVLRIDFVGSISNVDGHFDLKIDIDGLIGVILSSSEVFPKGANIAQDFSRTYVIYIRDTFKLNGGNIIIVPSHTMNIWNKTIVLNRIHAGR